MNSHNMQCLIRWTTVFRKHLIRADKIPFFKRMSSSMFHMTNITKELTPKAQNTMLSAHVHTEIDNQTDKEESSKSATEILANLSADDLKEYKRLQYEYELMKMDRRAQWPAVMTDEMWLRLLTEGRGRRKRENMFRYWHSIEKHTRQRENRKQRRMQEYEKINEGKRKEQLEDEYSNFLLRIYKSTILKHQRNHLSNAILYGQHIVYDLDYEDFMSHKDISMTFIQILYSHGWNKSARDAYHMVFCNARKDNAVLKHLRKHSLHEPFDLYTVTEKSYLDLYPKEKIVYLTPNSPKYLKQYSHDDIYVVGAFVDQSDRRPRSYAKAKQEGIRTAKLPLHLFLDAHHTNLTLDQVMAVMLTMKNTNDWKKALAHVPKRFLNSSDQNN